MIFLPILKNICERLLLHLWVRPATLLKNKLQHKCFPVNFAKFLRTPFSKEHLRWWLLVLKQGILLTLRSNVFLFGNRFSLQYCSGTLMVSSYVNLFMSSSETKIGPHELFQRSPLPTKILGKCMVFWLLTNDIILLISFCSIPHYWLKISGFFLFFSL